MSIDYQEAYEDAVHRLNQAMKALRQIELVLDDERKRYNALLRAVSQKAFLHAHPAVKIMAEPESFKAGQVFEREACAKLCESMTLEWKDQPDIAQAELATMMDCALAIRSRGQA